jgi:methyl-accepting chemotaxis protein
MKNLKVAMKLFVGFGLAVVLICIVGITSITSLKGLNRDYTVTIDDHGAPLADVGHVLEAIHSLRAENRACVIYTGNKEKIRGIRNNIDDLCKEYEKYVEEFSKHVIAPETRKMMAEADRQYKEIYKPGAYKMLDDAMNNMSRDELEEFRSRVTAPAGNSIAEAMKTCMDIKKGILSEAQAKGAALSNKIYATILILLIVSFIVAVGFGVYISALISKPLGNAVNMLNEMSHGHLDARLRLDRTDEIGALAKTMDMFADDMQNVVIGTMKKISDGDLSVKIDTKDPRDEIGAALKGTIDSLRMLIIEDGGKVLVTAAGKDLSQRLTHEYKGEFATMKDNINTVLGNLDEALGQVTEAVGQVTSASGQISSGAQSLAEGANEQASSLEEISSSLEEMSSMTKQNADNSNQAKLLATEARAAANEGDSSMKRMADAIRQIKTSSDNTAKIIKSIDDIAFQTNLLALNAAVEAARAGEAGKGFAVVAEEVRNLAMRSAEAAKNTANMIEESVKNADGGVKITEEVAKSLSQIVDRTGKVGDLIAEIAAASNEQAQGIEQVNTAVASMNQVTQSNAANSEESASASEELSSQASELASMVGAFQLSGGSGQQRSGARRGLPPPAAARRPAVAALPDKTGNKPKAAVKSVKAVRAEEVIPLDDDELNEF